MHFRESPPAQSRSRNFHLYGSCGNVTVKFLVEGAGQNVKLIQLAASAIHYCLVSLCLLLALAPFEDIGQFPRFDGNLDCSRHTQEDLLEHYATEICGIAFTSADASVLVNSFGPIAHCKCHRERCSIAVSEYR